MPLHQPIDLEEKPLLYEYYSNTLNPIIDKRNFDEIDRMGMDRLNKRFVLERPKQQQYDRFREVDHNDYRDYIKRMYNDERIIRPSAKRNFDEIDRFGPDVFVDSKRMYRSDTNEEDEPNKSKYMKK